MFSLFRRCYQKGQQNMRKYCISLTHWRQVTQICISKLTIIGSDDGLSLGRHQATIWTNAGILSIGPLGSNFSEMLIEIHTISFKKTYLKMSSAKWRPFCLGLNVLRAKTMLGAQFLSECLLFLSSVLEKFSFLSYKNLRNLSICWSL